MENKVTASSLYAVKVKTMVGDEATLAPYRGQVMLIVNVASHCGFTKQYVDLETLYQEYKARGFVVLGFPCNQFLHQEPGSDQAIKAFATECYHVTFPLYAKINVRGKQRAPLYCYLAKYIQNKPIILVPWNFTKFLVDRHGTVIKRYAPTVSFEQIRRDIDGLI